MAWGLLGVSPGNGNVLGWSLGVKEGASWVGLEDGNRSWAPRAEDGAIWGIAEGGRLRAYGGGGWRRPGLGLGRGGGSRLGCRLKTKKDLKFEVRDILTKNNAALP